jgi:tRNA G18 (ribose-2'-O)-methylase SpoU
MHRVQRIVSFELPGLQPYRTMRRQDDHRQQRIFVAEGEKVVRRLLESDFEVVSILMPEKWLVELEPLLNRRSEDITVYLAEKSLLENLTGFSMYQGLLAVGRIPGQPTLDDLLLASPRPLLFAAVDGLTSAENLGSVVRNCAGFGIQALVVSESSTSPYLRRAVRSSMGTIFQLPVIEASDFTEVVAKLKNNGVRCVAAHPHEDRTLTRTSLTGDCCIILGSEGYGISPPILQLCDEAVAIPMASKVDSLNVSAAAAVFFYEALRQRSQI